MPRSGTRKKKPVPAARRGRAGLTLGPLAHNWAAEERRDFYFRVADEMPFDAVCLGETVCAKRAPFFAPYLDQVAQRLARAGKEVVFSTLALVTGERDMTFIADFVKGHSGTVEANDLAAVELLRGRAHHIGPYVNVYSEDTVELLARIGAKRICLPVELPARAVAAVAAASPAEIEVVAFGRVPLAMSVRCFHARSRGRRKDTCRFVCAEDADGLEVRTIEDERFLAIAGCHILSHAYINLAAEAAALGAMGVGRFRLLPQAGDMGAVARIFRDLLDGRLGGGEATAALRPLLPPDVGFANGFIHGRPGEDYVAGPLAAGRGKERRE
ncbi:MAG: U32 family peptidase [Alphaproteobacteria bacterium]|nr:U32 family peptidase [Alphaproteobacteria bacterium]